MLNSFLQKYNRAGNFIVSRVEHSEPPTLPVFFYHLPKTGGISFSTSLAYAWKEHGAENLISRIGNEQHLNAINNQVIQGKDVKLVSSSNLNYGAHKRISTKFNLVAFFREPYSRIISHYSYLCMRERKIPKEKEFREFFTDIENVNLMTKRICTESINNNEQVSAQAAVNNLQKNFHAYANCKDVNRIIEYYLSVNRLPNIFMERINKTSPEYVFDGSQYKDEIIALNQEDVSLYNFVNENPRIPILNAINDNVSISTVVLYEKINKRKTSSISMTINTSDFVNKLDKKPEYYSKPISYFEDRASDQSNLNF